MLSIKALVALLVAPTVLGHFLLDYPQSRGFDEDIEPQFCGGFNESATRTPYPLGSAPLQIFSAHPSADVAIFISFDSNPTAFAQFNTTANGTTYGPLMNFETISGVGDFCFNVDIASLALPGVGNGTLATIQVEFNGGDGVLFQCADVILSSTFTAPANETCSTPNQTVAISAAAPATATGVTATVSATASPAATTAAKSAAGRKEVGLAAIALAAGFLGIMA